MKKLMISLAIILFILLVSTFFIKDKKIRFDVSELPSSGMALNQNFQTFQFATGDTMYRNWNNDQVIENTSDSNELGPDSILFMVNNSQILFVEDVKKISPNGNTETIPKNVYFDKQSNNKYSGENVTITNEEIIKVNKRNYFLTGEPKVLVNGEEVAQVKQPQILLDKAGVATIFSEGKKYKYLGEVQLFINDDIKFNVSNETIAYKGNVVDTGTVGNTDNQKKFDEVARTEDTVNNITEQAKVDQQALGVNQPIASQVNATENNTNSGTNNNNQSQSGSNANGSQNQGNNNGSIPNESDTGSAKKPLSKEEWEALMLQIDDLNKSLELKIPKYEEQYMIPGVNNVLVKFNTIDPSNVIVGPLKVDVVDLTNGQVIQTIYVDKNAGQFEIGNLKLNNSYVLKTEMIYDIGGANGPVTIVANGTPFETSSVTALYYPKVIQSRKAEVNIQLDSIIKDIEKAELVVYEADNSSNNFSMLIPYYNLNTIGETVVVSNLEPLTNYQFKLVLRLKNGQSIELNASNPIKTIEDINLQNARLIRDERNVLRAEYDWNSDVYNVVSRKLIVEESGLLGSEINTEILSEDSNSILFVPNQKKYRDDFTVNLELKVADLQSGTVKTFDYKLGEITDYSNYVETSFSEEIINGDITEGRKRVRTSTSEAETKVVNLNYKYANAFITPTNYSVEFQRKQIGSDEKWHKINSVSLVVNEVNEYSVNFQTSALNVEGYEIRAVLVDENGNYIGYNYY